MALPRLIGCDGQGVCRCRRADAPLTRIDRPLPARPRRAYRAAPPRSNVRRPGWLESLRRRHPGADWARRGTQAPLRCLSGNEAIADRDRDRALELIKQHNITDLLSSKSPDAAR